MTEGQNVYSIGSKIWPGIANVGGNLTAEEETNLKELISQLAEYIAIGLEEKEISRFTFPLFKPFNAVFGITKEYIFAIISSLTGGVATLSFFDWRNESNITMETAIQSVQQQLGWNISASFDISSHLLEIGSIERQSLLKKVANKFVIDIKKQIQSQNLKIKFEPIFKTKLENLEIDPSLCFVLMPFKPEFNRIYSDVLRPTIEQTNLKALKADAIFSTTPIVEDIWTHIAKAKLIIADVTDKNPNVFYELGLAHAIGKTVIIITQHRDDIPFDIAYIRYLIYEDNQTGWDNLRVGLTQTIMSVCK
jgi:hypothetical protein